MVQKMKLELKKIIEWQCFVFEDKFFVLGVNTKKN